MNQQKETNGSVTRGMHYATMLALMIANITTLALAVLISNTWLGAPMGVLAKQAVRSQQQQQQAQQNLQRARYSCSPVAMTSAEKAMARNSLTGSRIRWRCTGMSPLMPASPTNLAANTVSTSRVSLQWTDTAKNEAGFVVERALTPAGEWNEIAVVGANVVNFIDEGLRAGTTYYYLVRAYNDYGYSGYSNMGSATTDVNIPVPPRNPEIPTFEPVD